MAQLDKLLLMGCILRVFVDKSGDQHFSVWSDDYKIEVMFLHESTFTRYASRLYLLRKIEIPTGESYMFYRMVRQ